MDMKNDKYDVIKDFLDFLGDKFFAWVQIGCRVCVLNLLNFLLGSDLLVRGVVLRICYKRFLSPSAAVRGSGYTDLCPDWSCFLLQRYYCFYISRPPPAHGHHNGLKWHGPTYLLRLELIHEYRNIDVQPPFRRHNGQTERYWFHPSTITLSLGYTDLCAKTGASSSLSLGNRDIIIPDLSTCFQM